jgi:hypothetical protein
MSNLPSIHLLVGLVCFCGVTTPCFSADEAARPPVPIFSFADFPWFPVRGEFLPPPSGAGPVSYDKAHPRTGRTVDNLGVVQETTMHLADLSNPNLKPWVVDALKKANEERLAGVYMYASRASCRPPGIPMFLIYGAGFPRYLFYPDARRAGDDRLGQHRDQTCLHECAPFCTSHAHMVWRIGRPL